MVHSFNQKEKQKNSNNMVTRKFFLPMSVLHPNVQHSFYFTHLGGQCENYRASCDLLKLYLSCLGLHRRVKK